MNINQLLINTLIETSKETLDEGLKKALLSTAKEVEKTKSTRLAYKKAKPLILSAKQFIEREKELRTPFEEFRVDEIRNQDIGFTDEIETLDDEGFKRLLLEDLEDYRYFLNVGDFLKITHYNGFYREIYALLKGDYKGVLEVIEAYRGAHIDEKLTPKERKEYYRQFDVINDTWENFIYAIDRRIQQWRAST